MHTYTLARLAQGLAQKEFSSSELTRHFLQRIATHDPQLNSLISVTADLALKQATEADQQRQHPTASSPQPLLGIPLLHKDIFCTQGVRTSCASKMLDNFIAPYDAHVVQQLRSAGMVMLGKTNMDEFAMGSSNETSYYGPAHNPWDLQRVPGGSSGGSAAAVAARLAPAATGTDTGGSIRQPAALCGLTGLKPTYGRISRWGMVAFASSLDQAGPMTQTAADAALLLQAMSGHDPKDSTSVNEPVPDYSATLNAPLKGLRLGLPKEFFNDSLDASMSGLLEAALQELESLGAQRVEISLPHIDLSVPAYYVIAPAEASSNLSRFDGVRYGYRCAHPNDLYDLYVRSRSEGFGTEVKRRIMIGTYALSSGYFDAYYRKAQQLRRLIQQDFMQAMQHCDLIFAPTTPSTAFPLNDKKQDPVAMYLSDVYTIGVNLAGLPGINVPCGFLNGLPVGMQLVGTYWSEALLLNVAHRYQQNTAWHQAIPSLFC